MWRAPKARPHNPHHPHMTARRLDAWCYHPEAGVYEHEDFVRSLRDVIEGVSAVIWLPLSKKGSTGEYPYRLWVNRELKPAGLLSRDPMLTLCAFESRLHSALSR